MQALEFHLQPLPWCMFGKTTEIIFFHGSLKIRTMFTRTAEKGGKPNLQPAQEWEGKEMQ